MTQLYLEVKYFVKDNKFKISGNFSQEGLKDIIEEFLRLQIGQGADLTPPRDLDVYTIRLSWFPENDGITVVSNTGNKGLRDGILMEVLHRKGLSD